MQIYFVAQGNNLNSYLLISPNIPIYNNTSKAKRKKNPQNNSQDETQKGV